jgi:hypothetical protein
MVPAGQNFLPLMRTGGGKIPASTHLSIVLMQTQFCSASFRVEFSGPAGRLSAGSGILADMDDNLRDLIIHVAKSRIEP